MQSIISVNTNILLRRFRLKFLRIMYSTSCYKEHLNFENTLYIARIFFLQSNTRVCRSKLPSGWRPRVIFLLQTLVCQDCSKKFLAIYLSLGILYTVCIMKNLWCYNFLIFYPILTNDTSNKIALETL
jgi:hypothetical protein